MDKLISEDEPLTEAQMESIRRLELTICDFVGDSGCSDPDCWRCHSTMGPDNLRRLAENLATAALLCRAWQLRDACPLWKPGCGALPTGLPPIMEAAIASPHIGAFLRERR